MKLWFAASLLFLVSCAHKATQDEKKALVFIHGSHFDSTVWEQVLPDLQDRYDTYTITLMGRDDVESASLKEMATDACYQVQVPSVLVGHSFGGAVLNAMVGICPEKIQQLVYVTGLVPLNGEKPFDAMGDANQAAYEKAVKFDKERITPKEAKTFLLAMDADIDKNNVPAISLYSEAYTAGAAPLEYDAKVFEKISKAYIYTTHDQIIQMASQKKYTSRTKMKKTAEVESGHLPMLSKPKELATALKKVIN